MLAAICVKSPFSHSALFGLICVAALFARHLQNLQ